MRLTCEYFAIPIYSLWCPCSTIRIHLNIEFAHASTTQVWPAASHRLYWDVQICQKQKRYCTFFSYNYMTKNENPNECLPPNTKQSHWNKISSKTFRFSDDTKSWTVGRELIAVDKQQDMNEIIKPWKKAGQYFFFIFSANCSNCLNVLYMNLYKSNPKQVSY